ncbi:hypothetical protein STENM223S_02033 [Streptomyces tendae]
MLTGCWNERLPAPPLAAVPSGSPVPAQRRADGPLPSPADFVHLVRDRAVAALARLRDPRAADTADLARSCELAIRLALSCVVAPLARRRRGRAGPRRSCTGSRCRRTARRTAHRDEAQCAEPDSWSPITPTITRVIETIFSVDTRSPRNTIP